jgi:hypothetical protein
MTDSELVDGFVCANLQPSMKAALWSSVRDGVSAEQLTPAGVR